MPAITVQGNLPTADSALRQKTPPFAEAQGTLTDDNVFEAIS